MGLEGQCACADRWHQSSSCSGSSNLSLWLGHKLDHAQDLVTGSGLPTTSPRLPLAEDLAASSISLV